MAAWTSSSFARTASACSVDSPFEPYQLQTSDDELPPTLDAADIGVKRAREPGGTSSDCSDLGGYRVRVEASDDETAASDLGYLLTRVEGSLPFALPTVPVIDTRRRDDLHVWFTDAGDAFDGVIEVRVVDRAGNQSEPQRVHVADDSVGCACAVPGTDLRSSAEAWTLAALAALAGLACGRRRRAPEDGTIERPCPARPDTTRDARADARGVARDERSLRSRGVACSTSP